MATRPGCTTSAGRDEGSPPTGLSSLVDLDREPNRVFPVGQAAAAPAGTVAAAPGG